MHYKLSTEEMELFTMHRAELGEKADKLDCILNIIDKIIDENGEVNI